MDPARGLAAPRQAICDLVNEVFDFRAAAAVALGPIKVRGEYTYYDVNHVDDAYLLSVGVTYQF